MGTQELINNKTKKNTNLSLIPIICVIIFLILSDLTFLILLVIPITIVVLNKSINKFTYLYCLLFFGFILFELIVLKNNSIFNLSIRAINSVVNIKKYIIDFVQKHYQNNLSSFIKLILLNDKDWSVNNIYEKTVNLNIVYLLVISGLHLSCIKFGFEKIIRNKIICNVFLTLFLIFYCYLLNFSPSAMRVFICLILSWKIKNKYMTLTLSAIIILLLSPKASTNFGFILSFLCCFSIYWVCEFNIKSYFFKIMMINLVCIIISLPFVIMMTHKFSVLSLLFSFLFSCWFIFVFVYFLLGFAIVLFLPIHLWLMNATYAFINAFNKLNIECYINIEKMIACLYLCLIFILYIYLSKKHNISCIINKRW